jgi:hypothetical protein
MKLNISASLEKITPEIATEWLSEKWGDQRIIRPSHVARLAADMEAGRFKVSPDAVTRIMGKLANGQHRLMAVVSSGKAQQFLVLESNDEELYKVIDAGLKRTVTDAIRGMAYSKAVPSIARWVMSYGQQTLYRGARNSSEGSAGTYSKNTKSQRFPTQVQVINYCLENEDILVEASSFTNPLYVKTRLFNLSMGGAIYIIGSSRNKEKTKEFLEQVYVSGGQSAAGDLRNRLISNQTSRAKLRPGYIFGIAIKSLKSFLNGSRLGNLKWADSEGFPTI